MPSESQAQHNAMEAAAHGHSTLGIPESVGKEFLAADSATSQCAGILFRAPGQQFLLVQRSDNGQWEQPGGHIERGETAEQAAIRECIEEIGSCPDGDRWVLRQSKGDGVDYTCYLQDIAKFDPTLNHEHTAWQWCSVTDVPENTHPEVIKSMQLVTGNELDIAKHIQAGELASPQQYEVIWLFDVRVTGTGTSYRSAHDEYVYRPPEHFLSDEFLERCNGLPLIFEHPKKSILDTEEYRDRAIGTVLLPYIKGDEVWGIAKVYDGDAAHLMATTHISTSPAVVFRVAGSTETINLPDGQTVLIEGKPSYLDHLAVCENGVWDKGGAPSGINLGDTPMTPEEKARLDAAEEKVAEFEKADKERKDAEMALADKARKDAEEKSKAEGRLDGESDEEFKARKDKARKDSEEKDEFEKADKARKDAEEKADAATRANAELQKKLDAMQAQISGLTKPATHEDRDALSAAQSRADGIAQMFGDRVNAPLHGESPIDYRKRLAARFQKHSKDLSGVRLDSLDGAAFNLIEEKIYADAKAAALSPIEIKAGQLIPIVRSDEAGRTITEYVGDPAACWAPFMTAGMSVSISKQHQKGA